MYMIMYISGEASTEYSVSLSLKKTFTFRTDRIYSVSNFITRKSKGPFKVPFCCSRCFGTQAIRRLAVFAKSIVRSKIVWLHNTESSLKLISCRLLCS